MSQRGSFVTQYIYCDHCFQKVKKVLLDNDKYCSSIVIPSAFPADENGLPIIAGKVGGTWNGSEVFEINERLDNIEPGRCCDITIVVIPEAGAPETIVLKSDTKQPKAVNTIKRLTLKPEVETTEAMLRVTPNYITPVMEIVKYCKKRGYEITADIAYKAWAGFCDGYCSVEWIIPKFNDQFLEALISFCNVEFIEVKD